MRIHPSLTLSYESLRLIWPHLKEALEAAYVTIEIAAVGAIIAGLQLRYAKKRDRSLDIRNSWEKIHKAMFEFRLRREVLNNPKLYAKENGLAALETFEALHNLKGQLDRTPDSPLVIEITNFLDDNSSVEKWRADDFAARFDVFAHEAALKAR